VGHQVGNLSEDSEASISKPGSNNDILETDSEYSGYKECCEVECRALLDSHFYSQK